MLALKLKRCRDNKVISLLITFADAFQALFSFVSILEFQIPVLIDLNWHTNLTLHDLPFEYSLI